MPTFVPDWLAEEDSNSSPQDLQTWHRGSAGGKKGPDFLASRENPAIYRAISHGNMAQKAVRWQPGREGSLAHTFPEEPTGELGLWQFPIFLCVSYLRLAFTLATNRTAGIRKWRITFSVPAITSTSSTSLR